tara:strand:- start:1477 stop:1740 length:264 start_codon:yes stop_codon:yes gene_type:complete
VGLKIKSLLGLLPLKTIFHLQYRIDQVFDSSGRSVFKVIRIISGNQVGRDFYNLESAEEYIAEIVSKRIRQLAVTRSKNKEAFNAEV